MADRWHPLDFDATAANNDNIGGISQAESVMLPSSVNNAFRELASQRRRSANDFGAVNTVGGTGDAITVGLSAKGPLSVTDGHRFTFTASAANTGATTIVVTPSGASAYASKKVRKISGGTDVALAANDIVTGKFCEVVYDAAADSASGAYILLNPEISTSSFVTAPADPNADRFLGWDDSAGAYIHFAPSTNLVFSTTNVRVYETWAIAVSDETTAITTGTAKASWCFPYAFTVVGVAASLNTASSSGTPTFDINEAGTTILSTKIVIDANEKSGGSAGYQGTAAAAAVISDTSIAAFAEMTVDIDTAGTGAKGAKVYVIGYAT